VKKGIQSRASKGGEARKKSLTVERRKEIATKAAQAKWENNTVGTVESKPLSIHPMTKISNLKIGNMELPCAVLENRTPVVFYTNVTRILGRGVGGRTKKLALKSGTQLPDFLSSLPLERFVPASLRLALNNPMLVRSRGGTRKALPATLIPEICEVWLDADKEKALQPSQSHIVKNAEVLIRGFARVGITALVYEATDYEKIKGRDELEKILEAYISKELMPWTRMFPDDFYEYMFKLRGWQYDPLSVKRPRLVGKLTNRLIYEQLPKGVLKDLREKNPVMPKGYRKHKFFQFLTSDIGNPHLANQIIAVTTLMRVATSWSNFERLFDRRFSAQKEMVFPELERAKE
jgi:hypothetical protein